MIDENKIIIERPEILDKSVKFRDRVITLIFWGFLAYIFRPLVAMILWILFGMHIFDPNIFNMELYEEIKNFLIKNLFTIFSFVSIFLIWAVYNKIAFGNLRRRKAIPYVKDEEIAKFFDIEIDNLKLWKRKKHIKLSVFEKDDHFQIKEII